MVELSRQKTGKFESFNSSQQIAGSFRLVILTVKDDCRGITGNELTAPQSLGLLGMHERALMFDGELNVEGKPGKGTTVTARIPVGRGAGNRVSSETSAGGR
jgi:nitrate/nitrite-specific signal transduction histidine kinase